MTRWRTTVLTAAVLAATGAPARADTKLTIGYTGANTFVPAFVAKDKGFFARRGLDVTLQRIPVGPSIPGALIADSLQVGTLTAPIFLQANENGIELVVIAGASLHKSNPTAGWSHAPAPASRSPRTSRARRSVPRRQWTAGSAVQEMAAAEERRLENRHLRRIAVPADGRHAQGRTDGCGASGRAVRRTHRLDPGRLPGRALSGGGVGLYLESFYVVSKKWAGANAEAIKAFREALEEALAFVKTNTDEAKKTQITYLGLPEAVVATLPLATYTFSRRRSPSGSTSAASSACSRPRSRPTSWS